MEDRHSASAGILGCVGGVCSSGHCICLGEGGGGGETQGSQYGHPPVALYGLRLLQRETRIPGPPQGCNGKTGFRDLHGHVLLSSSNDTSVASLWRSMFCVKLDSMHLMLRIGKEMNAEHPRRKRFLVDLSRAILTQHQGDHQKLMAAREAAGLEDPPTEQRGSGIYVE